MSGDDVRRWALVAAFHHDEAQVLAPLDDRDAERLRACIRERIGHARPYEIREATDTALRALAAGVFDEGTGWGLILDGARTLQRGFRSWDALAQAWEQDIYGITDGRASGAGEARDMLAAAGQLPWDLDLGGDLPIRQRFALAIAAPAVALDGGDPRTLGGWRGRDEADLCRASLAKHTGARSRADVIAWIGPHLRAAQAALTGGHAGTARDGVAGGREPASHGADLVGAAAAAAWAGGAGILEETDAWHVLLAAAALAQRRYGGWDELADAYAAADPFGGGDALRTAIAELRAGWWTQLPWTTDLEVQLAAPSPRYLKAACPSCGAVTSRPSPTAFVYCDICAALVGYDFRRACADGLPQPGPAYEALREELAPLLVSSAIHDCRRAQTQLFDAFVEACPAACPVRTRDADYRARYVAYLAEGATRAAFDPRSRELEAAMTAAAGALVHEVRDGAPRFFAAPFRALCDAVFALEARRDELYVEHGVYAMQPDGATRDLQRAIGNSLFVQGWLPYLDATEAAALLARTGLALAYAADPPPATRTSVCFHCSRVLDVLVAARDVVCTHCGRITSAAEREPQGYEEYR